ncbi:MAG: tetratricopeptide repeat protein [Thermomicrobiales bacterium]
MLRWLSRPLWYLGRSPDAEETATAALRVLEQLPPGPELGWTYSDLSRLQVNAQQPDSAIAWGERALAIAARFGGRGLAGARAQQRRLRQAQPRRPTRRRRS